MFTILRDLIHERTGLFYESSKRDLLTEKLSLLVVDQKFNSFLDYYYLLRDDSVDGKAWGPLIDVLANQETYFWREIDAVHILVHTLVPQLFAKHGDAPLQIWSAACATGEEPLTIAMALHEAGWFERARIDIFASDASPAAIATARR